MAYPDRYLLFAEYFNQGKFMSAQTTLDEIWLDEEGQNKDFFGGLIQIAVSLYHLTNDNPEGARKIFSKARRMLSPYGGRYLGLDLRTLISHLDRLFESEIQTGRTNIDYLKLAPKIQISPE
jgi:uncharacterized protein